MPLFRSSQSLNGYGGHWGSGGSSAHSVPKVAGWHNGIDCRVCLFVSFGYAACQGLQNKRNEVKLDGAVFEIYSAA